MRKEYKYFIGLLLLLIVAAFFTRDPVSVTRSLDPNVYPSISYDRVSWQKWVNDIPNEPVDSGFGRVYWYGSIFDLAESHAWGEAVDPAWRGSSAFSFDTDYPPIDYYRREDRATLNRPVITLSSTTALNNFFEDTINTITVDVTSELAMQGRLIAWVTDGMVSYDLTREVYFQQGSQQVSVTLPKTLEDATDYTLVVVPTAVKSAPVKLDVNKCGPTASAKDGLGNSVCYGYKYLRFGTPLTIRFALASKPINEYTDTSGVCPAGYESPYFGATHCIRSDSKTLGCVVNGCPNPLVRDGQTISYECGSSGFCSETLIKATPDPTQCREGVEVYDAQMQACVNKIVHDTIVSCTTASECPVGCPGKTASCTVGRCAYAGQCDLVVVTPEKQNFFITYWEELLVGLVISMVLLFLWRRR